MSYSRPLRAGIALKQNPNDVPGIQLLTLDSDIATTSSLGVVQVGSGLSITPGGVLSASGGDSGCFVNVVMTSTNYTATVADCYIGVTNSDEERSITLTLPLGNIGKLYYIKNQGTGNIKIQGTSGQTIDGSSSKTLGTNGSFIVVFAGNRWNIL